MSNSPERPATKILIVADTPANLDLLRDILQPAGYQTFFAVSGQKALQIAASMVPDLILLDVTMPDMDGFETCRRIKTQDELRDIPLIFLTTGTDVEDLARGFDAGSVDYITKPIKRPEVLARVATHLQIRVLIKQQQEHLVALERAKKELQELNEIKDKFLSNLGREVGHALGGLSRASEQLRQSAAGQGMGADQINSHIQGVDRGAHRVLQLLETILEWPRIQAGQKLDLLATRISDDELATLVHSLNELRFLSLADTRVTDVGLRHLKQLHALQELHLDDTEVTDEGLKALAALPQLQILDLKRTKITDSGLANLKPLQNLRGLYLTGTSIGDGALMHLRCLPKLDTLILWDTAVSDAGLRHLHGISSLRELILWNTRVTKQGVAELQSYLPECDASTTAW
jgi:CheY-like chemotaxis protein